MFNASGQSIGPEPLSLSRTQGTRCCEGAEYADSRTRLAVSRLLPHAPQRSSVRRFPRGIGKVTCNLSVGPVMIAYLRQTRGSQQHLKQKLQTAVNHANCHRASGNNSKYSSRNRCFQRCDSIDMILFELIRMIRIDMILYDSMIRTSVIIRYRSSHGDHIATLSYHFHTIFIFPVAIYVHIATLSQSFFPVPHTFRSRELTN